MEQKTMEMKSVTIGMRKVLVGLSDENEVVCKFVKNEGTAIISTEIKLSPEIANQLSRLIRMVLSDKEMEKMEKELRRREESATA
jgi:hypothetical protein